MATNYTWKVTAISTQTQGEYQDFVVQTQWTKTGTDSDGITGEFSGATPFAVTSQDPAEFVPFDQLTEQIVLAWIQAVVVGEYEQHVNQQIDRAIAAKKDPVIEQPLPWQPLPASSEE